MINCLMIFSLVKHFVHFSCMMFFISQKTGTLSAKKSSHNNQSEQRAYQKKPIRTKRNHVGLESGKMCSLVAISFRFASDWLRRWRVFSGPIQPGFPLTPQWKNPFKIYLICSFFRHEKRKDVRVSNFVAMLLFKIGLSLVFILASSSSRWRRRRRWREHFFTLFSYRLIIYFFELTILYKTY